MVTIDFRQIEKKDHVDLDEDDDDHNEFEEGSDPSFRHSPLHPFLTFRRAPAITKCQKSKQDFLSLSCTFLKKKQDFISLSCTLLKNQ